MADPCDDSARTIAARAATATGPCEDEAATFAVTVAATSIDLCEDDIKDISTTTSAMEPCANDTTVTTASVSGSKNIDFGICTDPTMKFGGEFNGHPATEDTFLPANSDSNFGGQQSAFNPNIIASFTCDTFVNRCKAGTDAIAAYTAAKAITTAKTIRDVTVATKPNSALEF